MAESIAVPFKFPEYKFPQEELAQSWGGRVGR